MYVSLQTAIIELATYESSTLSSNNVMHFVLSHYIVLFLLLYVITIARFLFEKGFDFEYCFGM